MNNFFKKHKHIRVILLSLALLLLIIINILVIKNAFDVAKENTTLEASILSLEDKQKQLQSIKQDLKSVLDDYGFLHQLFVSKDAMPDFLQFLETAMREEGVSISINSVTSNPISEEYTSLEEVQIHFNLNGTQKDLERSIRKLEVFPFKTNIRNISFGLSSNTDRKENGGENKNQGLWNALVVLSVIKNK